MHPVRTHQPEFQSTRPHGARRSRYRHLWFDLRFNPRARTGRDAPRPVASCLLRRFNPRARTGRDPTSGTSSHSRCCFNPRARTGRDLRQRPSPLPPARSFNPRARTGRDGTRCLSLYLKSLFQSTRPHGARREQRVRGRKRSSFQSTRPHGARPHGTCRGGASVRVSIHAPARGATTLPSSCRSRCRRFNPRARTGRDCANTSAGPSRTRFNPRARTGRDIG